MVTIAKQSPRNDNHSSTKIARNLYVSIKRHVNIFYRTQIGYSARAPITPRCAKFPRA